MAVGVLTRESVRRALQVHSTSLPCLLFRGTEEGKLFCDRVEINFVFQVGIRAEQIVGYLRSHAQEQVSVQKTPQPLPVTVIPAVL